MQVGAYLERIRYRGPRTPTADALRALQRTHLLAVPFENLDIHLGRPIVLALPALYDKLVVRRRGGFCYELNALFGWLLGALGFRVSLLSAGVFGDGGFGPEYDHMALRVDLAEPWLVDVGFGDSFVEPLRLQAGTTVRQRGWRYAFESVGARWVLRRAAGAGPWEPQYAFALAAQRLDDYAPRCLHHQTSPQSHFTRQVVCSRATTRGRITLSDARLIRTVGRQRAEREVQHAAALRAVLAREFGVQLPQADAARLLRAHGGC